jgi:glutamyl-Q tRNA(Asp) synthetase
MAVRIEDVDETRSVPGAAEEILRQLEGFGFAWDGEVVWQSRRKPLYEAALNGCAPAAWSYRCRCSRREVADSALQGVEGAVYPGTCRAARGRCRDTGAERMRVDRGAVEFIDRVQGRIAQDVPRAIGDFVLKRRDSLHAYQLAVVVDDAEQRVTDVVRGADLLQSTPRQILLQRALGYPTPRYLHFPWPPTSAARSSPSRRSPSPPTRGARASCCARHCDSWARKRRPRPTPRDARGTPSGAGIRSEFRSAPPRGSGESNG